MSVLIVLILASLAVGLTFLGAFIWSVRSGQYEDTLTPSMRMLLDDTSIIPNSGGPPASLPVTEKLGAAQKPKNEKNQTS